LAAQGTTGALATEREGHRPVASVAAVLGPIAVLDPERLAATAATPATAAANRPAGQRATPLVEPLEPALGPAGLRPAEAGLGGAAELQLRVADLLAAPGAPGRAASGAAAQPADGTATPPPAIAWLRHPVAIALDPARNDPLPPALEVDGASRWGRRFEQLEREQPDSPLLLVLEHAGDLDANRSYSDHHGVTPTHQRWDLRLRYRPDQATEISVSLQDVFDPLRTEQLFLGEQDLGVGLQVTHRF
jgi:hypothetical protein